MSEKLVEKVEKKLKGISCTPKKLDSTKGYFCSLFNCYCDGQDKNCKSPYIATQYWDDLMERAKNGKYT